MRLHPVWDAGVMPHPVFDSIPCVLLVVLPLPVVVKDRLDILPRLYNDVSGQVVVMKNLRDPCIRVMV
jgi:hypothetical protein